MGDLKPHGFFISSHRGDSMAFCFSIADQKDFLERETSMTISNRVRNAMEDSSWVRRMFEEGEELKRLHGAEKVFDFSLGNPEMEPPPSLKKELKALADHPV